MISINDESGLVATWSRQLGRPLPGGDSLRPSRVEVAAGSPLFQQGDPVTSVFFIVSGIVKLTYTSRDGVERIKSFLSAPQLVGSLAAIATEVPSPFRAIAVTDISVERYLSDDLLRLTHEHHEWSLALNQFLLSFAERKERREEQFLTMTAEERYRAVAEAEPELVATVTQRELAAYLGVTPEGLNRIIKRSAR